MNDYAFEVERSVLECRGGDVVRFLNGQLSNDVNKLQPNLAMHACVMTAKGRMNAEVWLTKIADGIRLDGPPNMGEELLARFERYIISDDVTVEEVAGIKLYHVTGDFRDFAENQKANEIQYNLSRRFNRDGLDYWIPKGSHCRYSHNVENLTPDQFESFRIAQGVPRWGAELDENTLPVEAGLDRDCIDYHKGCYIGQEVISRLKSVGHVNRLLIRLIADKHSTMARGTKLFFDEQPIGTITSEARSLDLENVVALAYVKRAYSTPGTMIVTENGERLTVHTLQL